MPHCSCIKLYFLKKVCVYIISGFSGQWEDIYYCQASFTYGFGKDGFWENKTRKKWWTICEIWKKKKQTWSHRLVVWWLPVVAQTVKNLPPMHETGFNPWAGKTLEGRHSNPLQYSCLENFMDTGAWRATVHGVAELNMTKQLSLSHFFTQGGNVKWNKWTWSKGTDFQL